MACWLSLVNSYNIKTFSLESILKKSKYLAKIFTFLISSNAIWVYLAGCIDIKLKLIEVIYTIKVSIFLSNAALKNLFLLIISIYLMVSRALAVI